MYEYLDRRYALALYEVAEEKHKYIVALSGFYTSVNDRQ